MDLYDVDELFPLGSGLGGHKASVTVETVREGEAPVSGNFRLKFRETSFSDDTGDIAYNADEDTMRTALLNLAGIDDVSVTRSEQNAFGGYTWDITFLSVNQLTSHGIVEDTMGNLKPLTPITEVSGSKILKGTNAKVEVSSAVSGSPVGDLEVGSSGLNTGAAYVYVKMGNQWILQSTGKLVGSDSEVGDQFGYSVSIDGDRAIAGAPFAVRISRKGSLLHQLTTM